MRKNQFLAKFLHFINLSYFASHHHSLELFKQQEDLKKNDASVEVFRISAYK